MYLPVFSISQTELYCRQGKLGNLSSPYQKIKINIQLFFSFSFFSLQKLWASCQWHISVAFGQIIFFFPFKAISRQIVITTLAICSL